jgi:hypothetical protein
MVTCECLVNYYELYRLRFHIAEARVLLRAVVFSLELVISWAIWFHYQVIILFLVIMTICGSVRYCPSSHYLPFRAQCSTILRTIADCIFFSQWCHLRAGVIHIWRYHGVNAHRVDICAIRRMSAHLFCTFSRLLTHLWVFVARNWVESGRIRWEIKELILKFLYFHWNSWCSWKTSEISFPLELYQ